MMFVHMVVVQISCLSPVVRGWMFEDCVLEWTKPERAGNGSISQGVESTVRNQRFILRCSSSSADRIVKSWLYDDLKNWKVTLHFNSRW